ncbi:MAG: hypothetical protein WDZ49_06090 [Litorilinea sp.]
MPNNNSRPAPGDELYTTVDQDQFDDLMDLTGQQVAQVVLWDDSMAAALESTAAPNADDLADDPANTSEAGGAVADTIFDLDLYLKDGVYFELYGVQFYPSLDSEPLTGYDTVQAHLRALIQEGLWLDDLGVDEEDGLVLILCRRRTPLLYVPAGAWYLDEWDELPDDSPDSQQDEDQDDDQDND